MNKGITAHIYNAFLLFIAFVLYSFESIFGKLASRYDFLSPSYLFYLFCVLFSLCLYAILWQKILKYIQLNKAFLCKSITILIVLSISRFMFNEEISKNNCIGAFLIIAGIINLTRKE